MQWWLWPSRRTWAYSDLTEWPAFARPHTYKHSRWLQNMNIIILDQLESFLPHQIQNCHSWLDLTNISPFGNHTGDGSILAKVITHASVQYFCKRSEFLWDTKILLHDAEIVFMFEKYFVRYLNGGLVLLTTRLSLLVAATFPKISFFSSSSWEKTNSSWSLSAAGGCIQVCSNIIIVTKTMA